MTAPTFSPTLFADIVLAALALEAAWLLTTRSGRRLDILFALAPGACLALALRAALAHDPWFIVAACLAASGPAHLADLARRGLLGAQTIPRARKPSASASE